MGTSTPYNGPVGEDSLLPPWAPPPPDAPDNDNEEDENDNGREEETDQQPTPESQTTWSTPKGQFTRFVSSGGGRSNANYLKNSARGFVRAQGGSRNAASAAVGGRRSARRLGNILSYATTHSVADTAEAIGIDFVGQSAESFISALVDYIAPDAASNEDAVTRRAVAETLCILFEELAVEDDGLDALSNIDTSTISNGIEIFVTTYISDRLMEVLAKNLENRSASTTEACRIEREVKEFIAEQVNFELSGHDLSAVAWLEAEGDRFAQDLFEQGYELIESWS